MNNQALNYSCLISMRSIFGSSRPEVFCKKTVHRNFAKFTGKHLCQSLFLIKLQEISKNTFSYKTPPVAASAYSENTKTYSPEKNVRFIQCLLIHEFPHTI